jgi:hypothetical protein
MTGRNSSERLVSYMVQLRRHLLKCHDCKGAIAIGPSGTLCKTGAVLTVSAAREFNGVIEMRRRAMAHGDGLIHACPDLSKHGEAYALTARMFVVTGVQEELF